MITITEQELNKAYTKVNECYKQGIISKEMSVEVKSGSSNLMFKFFPTMGRRGSWCITTDVNVLHNEN